MTNTTDIKALRNRAASEVIANKGLISAELAMILINQLEAERQRADANEGCLKEMEKYADKLEKVGLQLEAELAALRDKYENS